MSKTTKNPEVLKPKTVPSKPIVTRSNVATNQTSSNETVVRNNRSRTSQLDWFFFKTSPLKEKTNQVLNNPITRSQPITKLTNTVLKKNVSNVTNLTSKPKLVRKNAFRVEPNKQVTETKNSEREGDKIDNNSNGNIFFVLIKLNIKDFVLIKWSNENKFNVVPISHIEENENVEVEKYTLPNMVRIFTIEP